MTLRAAGFTLLEMLLVLVLMGTTAAMAFAMLGNRQHQARYDDTLRRLDALRTAVAGEAGAAWGGEARLAGFVADNGRLPGALSELTDPDLADADECAGTSSAAAADKLDCHKPRAPLFDPVPATDGYNDGGETTLGGDAEKLAKGYRRLLEARAGGTAYRDGWGNTGATDDGSNFGWTLTLPADADAPFRIKSLGSNNQADTVPPSPDDDLAADIERTILADDWGLDIAGWTVRLGNESGASQPATGYLAVSLLVYENRLGGGRWRRFTTGYTGSLADGDHVDLAFPAGGYPGGTLPTRIPQGEHLLVVVASDDTTLHDADDAPFLLSGERIVAAARFYAHASRPVVEMRLR